MEITGGKAPAPEKKQEHNILLVDANLHQPSLHQFFGLSNEKGLGEIVEHKLDWRQYVIPIKDSHLKVITAGKADVISAELFGSDEFKTLVDEWRKEYRYVIFDSPPVLTSVEALSLSSLADGVILVVRAGKTRWEIAQNAKRKLATVGSNLLGVALNRQKMNTNEAFR
jgi:capsular exopolysaccharide synthesis family protein